VRRLLLAAGAAILLGGCAGRMAEAPPLSAEAVLKDKDGKQVGVATLIQTPDGTRIAVTGYRLTAGKRGLHIHEVGACQPPDFESAGAHFNPGGKKHGKANPEGPHAGDLGNIDIGAAGDGTIDVTTKAVTLNPGQTSLLGGKGTSIVLHAMPDDERTDPSGNTGARIACGVIAP
jgi:superoxide dismutase, Cu-Zn family